MRRLAITLLAGFVLVSISTHDTIHAQETSPSFKIGGGLGFPIDAEGTKNGLAIRGGVSVPVYQNLHAVLEGHYNQNSAEEDPAVPGLSGETKLSGAHLGVMLRSSTSPISVYGQGGIGLTRVKSEVSGSLSREADLIGQSFNVNVSNTDTALSFTIGGGVHIPINPSIGVAVDARYSHAATDEEATKWMPITASIVFSL